ncbi:MAG: permease [Verrucomicrobiota bacterium]
MTDPAALSPFNDFCYLFLSIVVEGAPFILLGTLISGIIDAYLPPGLIDKWLPKNKPLAVILSGLLGAVFPVCECAIVPVIRRLIRKGLPVSCAITYMLSSPIINPIVIGSTMTAFSKSDGNSLRALLGKAQEAAEDGPLFMTSSRLLIAFIVCVLVGFIILKLKPSSVVRESLLKGGSDQAHDHSHGRKKWQHAIHTTFSDFIETAMYFTIGVMITAIFRAYVTQDLVMIFNQNEVTGIGLMMVLAFILSLCSTTDAFIAANFPVPISARPAFLVYGPMMDVKLIFMYLSVLKKRFVLILAISLFFAIGLLAYVWVRL